MKSSVRHRSNSSHGKGDLTLPPSHPAVTVVSPRMGEQGWPFASVDKFPAADIDPLYGSQHVKDLYFKANPSYEGRFVCFTAFSYSGTRPITIHRFTVPVLWDKKNHTIVNNESSEIIRIFNTEFNDLIPADKAKIDIYPEGLRSEIDSINDWVYNAINS